jgi:solute:Na+ symporter, SSS family
MLQALSTIDLVVVVVLILFIIFASMYSSFKQKNSEEYFMAGHSLRWWSVAGSIFGTNIHAQQIIGMMGIGYSIGFAQSHYEIWAVPAILVLTYVFIPIYRKRNFFTLSQFLENRYNSKARLAYTILMISFIMIQLIGGFYIGSRTLGLLTVGTSFELSYLQGILIIAGVTVVFSVFGGMESVVIADNILTVIMLLAVVLMGILTYSQPEVGGLANLLKIDAEGAAKMHLYLPANHPKLPWLGIFTGLTILNFFYWTTNQYQVQRVLAAKSDYDAKMGTIVAGFLKLIIPFFSIGAGVAAHYLFTARFGANVIKPDDTFLTLLKTVVPTGYGFVGLILAGLTCAIFSAIYSMMNSVSTMMAFDVYKKYLKPEASDKTTVLFGQVFVGIMCAIAVLLALVTFDPNSSENFFLKIANQTSYLKPGLVVVFFWGILYKRTHPLAAVIVLLISPLIGLGCDFAYAHFLSNIPWITDTFGQEFNFLYRVFSISVLGSLLIYFLSTILQKNDPLIAEAEFTVPFKAIAKVVWPFALVHFPLILLTYYGVLPINFSAFIATIITLCIFIWYKIKFDKDTPILQSHIFYAGLLTSAMVFMMYFFA